MKKHVKHQKLERVKYQEISLLGTACTKIEDFTERFAESFCGRLAYLDGDHDRDAELPFFSNFTFNDKGFFSSKTNGNIERSSREVAWSSYDLILVNGNHFKAKKQIVFLDPAKRDSVLRRLDQLTDLIAVVCLESWEIYPELNLASDCPVLKSEDELISFLLSRYELKPLDGLILLGGKSERMGRDKGEIKYGDHPQKLAVNQLLGDSGLANRYFSVRQGQHLDLTNRIEDEFLNLGPMGGILSAFKRNPNNALLVLANDLPYLKKEHLELLISERDPNKVATAFKGRSKDFVEPLICIYEPKAYPILLAYLAAGYSCPRKMLINNEVKVIEVEDMWITNVNTEEELKIIQNADGLQ